MWALVVLVVVTAGIPITVCSNGYSSGTEESEQMPARNRGSGCAGAYRADVSPEDRALKGRS